MSSPGSVVIGICPVTRVVATQERGMGVSPQSWKGCWKICAVLQLEVFGCEIFDSICLLYSILVEKLGIGYI